jgi:hypothetical protein
MRARGALLAVVALLALPMAGAEARTLAGVRRSLREAHVSYPLAHRHDHRPVLRIVGAIAAGGERYLVVYWNWEESRRELHERGGNAQHASHRLLVLRRSGTRLSYLGYYSVDIPPLRIEGRAVLFDGDAEFGNTVTFDDHGPPEEIRLDGEFHVFDRGPE